MAAEPPEPKPRMAQTAIQKRRGLLGALALLALCAPARAMSGADDAPASANRPVSIGGGPVQQDNAAPARRPHESGGAGAATKTDDWAREGSGIVGPPAPPAPERGAGRSRETSTADASVSESQSRDNGDASADPGSAGSGGEERLSPPAAEPGESAEALPAPSSERRPLGPALGSTSEQGAGSTTGELRSFGADAVRTIGALALVVVLIVALRLGLRRAARGGGSFMSQLGPGGKAPSGVLTVLARYPVGKGQTLVLLQMDRRVLLLSQSGAGFQTLCEVTDPDEVASLLVRTRDEEGESLASRFRSLLGRFERDPDFNAADVEEIEVPSSVRTQGTFGDVFADAERVGEAGVAPSRQSAETEDAVASLRRRLATLREGEA